MGPPGSLHATGHGPGLRDTVPGQDLVQVTGGIIASGDMEELPDLGSTEENTGRGQGAGLPPAACTRAGVGEQLGGGQAVAGVAAGDQQYLESGAVMEDWELAALPGSPRHCTSHTRGRSEGGGVEAAPWR